MFNNNIYLRTNNYQIGQKFLVDLRFIFLCALIHFGVSQRAYLAFYNAERKSDTLHCFCMEMFLPADDFSGNIKGQE